jgi:hypothetical protein
VKFFFPDSSDMVDPTFDFGTESRVVPVLRSRQRDYHYAHELFPRPPYDGILVSKTAIDVKSNYSSRYTVAQQFRFMRVGVREFFRLDHVEGVSARIESMGDCGAFSYVREEVPPFSVDDLVEFYGGSGFDYGLSLDHVILGYRPGSGGKAMSANEAAEWARRQELTLTLAAEFLRKHRRLGCRFEPIGIAQGWSPDSYAQAADSLQSMGYNYIALGGMVGLKTRDILTCLERIDAVRRPATRIHLLGIRVTRQDLILSFCQFGVKSFDTTAPLRQAFKDDRDNYYTPHRTYQAIRVPQASATPKLVQRIKAGLIDQDKVRGIEQECMQALALFDAGQLGPGEVLSKLRTYEEIYDGGVDRTEFYREILADRPWKRCPCEVCTSIGIQVMIFRGAERHKRRGFHNLFVSYQQLRRQVGRTNGRDELGADIGV